VGRTNEISRLQTAATHSNNGVSGHLSLVQQNVQQAKSMMDASSQMSQASSTMAANALQAINNIHQQLATKESCSVCGISKSDLEPTSIT